MSRTVKDYHIRWNEILDAAQRLIYTKGYERMTIQNILDDLHIAKGLFYYYFDSKQAMLVALTERMMETSARLVEPIVADAALPALEKLDRFFATLIQSETEQKTFMLALLPVWYMAENVVVREKMRTAVVQHHAAHLAAIVRQGVHEGVMHTAFPDQAGDIALLLYQGLKEALAHLLLSSLPGGGRLELSGIEELIAAYADTLAHVFGIPAQALHLADRHTLAQWLGTLPSEV